MPKISFFNREIFKMTASAQLCRDHLLRGLGALAGRVDRPSKCRWPIAWPQWWPLNDLWATSELHSGCTLTARGPVRPVGRRVELQNSGINNFVWEQIRKCSMLDCAKFSWDYIWLAHLLWLIHNWMVALSKHPVAEHTWNQGKN